MKEDIFPKEEIRHMLHALGISHAKNNSYIQPNRRYCPYPTSHRNYYQIDFCRTWEHLVYLERAVKGVSLGMNYYSVSEKGKEHLRELGYKWHEERKKRKDG